MLLFRLEETYGLQDFIAIQRMFFNRVVRVCTYVCSQKTFETFFIKRINVAIEKENASGLWAIFISLLTDWFNASLLGEYDFVMLSFLLRCS